MNIDHHLQLTLLRKLAASNEPMRYSDLKEGDVENSLFSYHLNKLLNRGMVSKIDDGYIVSIEGARWLNDNGFALKSKEKLRVFVTLVVQNENGDYLIGQRTGQMKAVINDYMLPSIPYVNKADIDDQITDAIIKHIPAKMQHERTNFGFTQIKASYIDDRIMRSLFSITHVRTEVFEPLQDNQSWMSRTAIDRLDHPSATILREILDYTQDDSRAHDTPLFAG